MQIELKTKIPEPIHPDEEEECEHQNIQHEDTDSESNQIYESYECQNCGAHGTLVYYADEDGINWE